MSLRLDHSSDPGARWLRCDLHVHTPFDREKKFGEDIRGAIDAFKKQEPKRLAMIADNFVNACRAAADGRGMDLVAVTDHNSIEGYLHLKPAFDVLAEQAADQGLPMPVILPGVEFSIGGERPIHFLVIFSSATSGEDIRNVIQHVFGSRRLFNKRTGTPQATGKSVSAFLNHLYEYCHPDSRERNIPFVLLPAHADGARGVAKETGVRGDRGVGGIMEEMKGHLRRSVVTRRDWHGFQTAHPFAKLAPGFQELLLEWAASRKGEDWDTLASSQKQRYRNQRHWPLVECSDPHNYDSIGNRFSWLKMEVPDVEGIRIALLDPESRLRRMADGPPNQIYTRLQRIRVKGTDFFDDIEIPISPCLTTFIGGRGTGKSTLIEYLRHAVDRARLEDLPDKAADVREAVRSILLEKDAHDFGHTEGTLLPDHQITIDIVVAEQCYRVRRSSSGIAIVRDPDQQGAQPMSLDVRSLVSPRILSQRQIARIAREPASQRTELDALIDNDRLREIEEHQRVCRDTLAKHQASRVRLAKLRASGPTVITELQKVNDEIAFFESDNRKKVLARFDELERERQWLEDALREIKRLANELESTAADLEKSGVEPPHLSELESESRWLHSVEERMRDSRDKAESVLRAQADSLRLLHDKILSERAGQWQTNYDKAKQVYATVFVGSENQGIGQTSYERLLQRRAQLERKSASAQKANQELKQLEKGIEEVQRELEEGHKMRVSARKDQAQALKEMDADVRLNIVAFGDRVDFESRRSEWFGGAGLQERDWAALCDYVFCRNGSIPDRLRMLVKALWIDIHASSELGKSLSADGSKVASLVGSDNLTRHFFNALAKGDKIRIDEMERFLPEDLVQARVRAADGAFKSIETGSVGEKSTAVLSLLLSAGDQPIVIDQPEDDLDNQYVHNVVVDLVRRRKFNRQIIIATHNANIPVNGDAELIVALGAEDRMGKVLGAGSIDRQEIKELVTEIMEGSAEAFRLRRERYGY